jgi:hypothetical protein
LVIRKVESSVPTNVLPEVDAWVVESDRRQNLDDIPTTAGVDLQVDYSPFILGGNADNLDDAAINQQAEVFIGHREPASTWKELYDPTTPPDKQPLRVVLNLLGSSNELFADYQPHNGNVFSIIDPLQYGKDAQGNPLAVTTATVSYSVLGWHPSELQDPLGGLDPSMNVTRGDRLAALNMVLDRAGPDGSSVDNWLDSKTPTRVVCHGSMYQVLWDNSSKPPIVPADDYFKKLNCDMPVAVGTTPNDALLAYIKSHGGPGVVNGDDIREVEQDLLRIQRLRFAAGDRIEDQAEADDMVYNWNFASTEGGSHYFLASSDGGKDDTGRRPTAPNPADIAKLTGLNNSQAYLDALNRQLRLLRWGMFVSWWQYMSDLHPTTTSDQVAAKSREMLGIMGQIGLTMDAVGTAKSAIPSGLANEGVLPPFYQARDPTMLVAGIETGWAWDYLDPLQTRLDTQLYYTPGATPAMDDAWVSFSKLVLPKLPSALQGAAEGLIGEFIALDPGATSPPSPQAAYQTPLYHDLDKKHALPDGRYPWRDRWEQSQAWFPLFLEWEAEYTHVPLGPESGPTWTLDQRGAWPDDPVKLRYGIAPGIELADAKPPLTDKRTLSGRVLLLPQATLNVQNMVTGAIDTAAEGTLSPDQIQDVKDNLQQLAFLSAPLSGFTDHLLTRVQGNHIKPCVRDADAVTPFKAAIAVGQDIGFQKPQLSMMGLETALVPYGTLVSYLNNGSCPFKPATHGQFRFTALNIIDKFGQAIHAIDPTPTPDTQGPPPLYPCISEYYVPQSSNRDAAVANTVVQDKPGLCQYVQLPPSINQPARLNTAFVDFLAADAADAAAGTPAGWQPLTEWDNPVWGWVVPNYADSGIQLFLPDGTFFREIRLGGPGGATGSGTWLPFDAPSSDISRDDPNVHQLQLLASQLANKDYLQSFIAMVNTSMGTSAPPPTAYSEFLSALVGKPLALVKVGFSLELATNQLFNTSTVAGPPADPEVPLLASSRDPDNHYRFQMQLGDASRVYDGLVGYFLPSPSPQPGDALELGTLYTHFVPNTNTPPNLVEIAEPNYPVLSPFWIDPMASDITQAPDPGAAYAAKRAAQLRPLGALVDPFVPLHAYTGVLPTAALQLPAWTWQTALANMTAFFRMGPLLVAARDVPAFQAAYELGPDGYDVADDARVLPNSGLGIPAQQTGQWAWLQPYDVEAAAARGGRGQEERGGQGGRAGAGGTAAGAAGRPRVTKFMAMDMATVDERPRFEPAPYTALEGYMQLRRPIRQDVVPPSPSS